MQNDETNDARIYTPKNGIPLDDLNWAPCAAGIGVAGVKEFLHSY